MPKIHGSPTVSHRSPVLYLFCFRSTLSMEEELHFEAARAVASLVSAPHDETAQSAVRLVARRMLTLAHGRIHEAHGYGNHRLFSPYDRSVIDHYPTVTLLFAVASQPSLELYPLSSITRRKNAVIMRKRMKRGTVSMFRPLFPSLPNTGDPHPPLSNQLSDLP